jgi:hypothetical protein
MTFHITGGTCPSILNSDPITSYTPIERISGLHWGVWVFEFNALTIAVPPPWGTFQEHEELNKGITRVAVAGVWPDGFLGRDGAAGKGHGRIYFDSRPNGEPVPPNLQADLQALVRRLVDLPSDQKDPQEPPVGSPLRQLAVLTYLINHCDKGPFAPFHQLTMEDPWVLDITIEHTFAPAPSQDELTIVSAAGVGGFKLRPYHGADGEAVRLTNAEPQLRQDINLGDALDAEWKDPDLFKAAGVGPQVATNPLGEGLLPNWNWRGVGGPPLTGIPHA